ncbi:MAG TPA: pyrroloquinoline quinone biosynthesis protein PqqB [Xanthobacteraceae bacterium]|nr:pyrroloquinoline quinone biosynthesis protein PqqB [Xanthobacteraceae bacterium]
MTTIVLGSAAGGGFPQWNCCCPVCRLAWQGDARVRARTQVSLAVSRDGEQWTLLNAAPDLRAQLAAVPALHPIRAAQGAARGSPIKAVVLTGAEVDQTAGLLNLRERQPFALHATAQTMRAVADNPMFAVLADDLVSRHVVAPGARFPLPGGLEAELFAVPGKVPLYLEEGDAPDTASETEANVGVMVTGGGGRLAFVPGAAVVTPALKRRLAEADVVLFDGTLFTDDEMIATGTGTKTGRRMGHMPIDGPEGSLAALADVAARRIYIHINNTNPILVEGSPERRRVEAAGWEVAADGLEIAL